MARRVCLYGRWLLKQNKNVRPCAVMSHEGTWEARAPNLQAIAPCSFFLVAKRSFSTSIIIKLAMAHAGHRHCGQDAHCGWHPAAKAIDTIEHQVLQDPACLNQFEILQAWKTVVESLFFEPADHFDHLWSSLKQGNMVNITLESLRRTMPVDTEVSQQPIACRDFRLLMHFLK